jgi:hypothetical protein
MVQTQARSLVDKRTEQKPSEAEGLSFLKISFIHMCIQWLSFYTAAFRALPFP